MSTRQRTRPTFIEAARREQIVESTIAVLAVEGSTGLTFAKIARHAGITAGLITYHFGTKDELVAAVRAVLLERLDAAMSGHGEEPTGYLHALHLMVSGFVEHCAARPQDMLALGHLPTDEAEHQKDVGELAAMLGEGQTHGEVVEGDTRLLAGVVLAAMRSVPAELSARSAGTTGAYAHELALTLVRAVAAVERADVRRSLRGLAQSGH